MSGRLLRWALAAALLTAAAGHFLYAYLPRERAGVPDPDDVPARLLAAAGHDLGLWLPYPHQNLGVAAEAVGDPEAYLAAAAAAADLPPPPLPAFGPFRAPPARELAVALDRDGGVVAAARVYPLLAVVARLAGGLADNPWLAGGEVEAGGRRTVVRWQGTLWTVGEVPAVVPVPAAAGDPATRPALARLDLRSGAGWVPAGRYALTREGAALVLAPAGTTPAAAVAAARPLAGTDPALAALAFESSERRSRALALFAEGGHNGLPGAAAFSGDGGERWKLPGEGVLSLLTGQLASEQAAGWQIVALDRQSLDRGRALAPALAALRRETAGRRLWLAPGPAYRLVDRVADILAEVPLLGRDRARRWRAWATLLAPLSEREMLSLVVGRGEGELVMVLR